MDTLNLVSAAVAILILDGLAFQTAEAKPGPVAHPPVEPFYLTSTGKAGDKYPELMGVYEQSQEVLNDLPVFKQVDGPGNIFAHKIGIWVVSKTLDDSDKRPLMWSARYNKLSGKSSPMPYTSEWKYYDDDCRSGSSGHCSYSLRHQTKLGGYEGTEYAADYRLQIVPTQAGSSGIALLDLLEDWDYYVPDALLDKWNHYLPDDVDADHDGEVTKEEIQLKIKEYIKYVFDHLDKDTDNIVSQLEFGNASIDMHIINKIVDIAFKSFPLKKFLGHGDRNQDGFISEDDLLLPDEDNLLDEAKRVSLDPYDVVSISKGNWTVKGSVLQQDGNYGETPVCADSIGPLEAEVLCRQLGHIGLESLSPISLEDYKASLESLGIYSHYSKYFTAKISCTGNEATLDECVEDVWDDYDDNPIQENCPRRSQLLASVTCKPNTEIGGEIVLKGGKGPSMGALFIGDAKYGAEASPNVAKVACRQLGFAHGIPQTTYGQLFFRGKSPLFKRKFECNGSEERLEDCQLVADINTYPWTSAGIICNSTFKLEDKEMNDKYGEPAIDFTFYWEEFARYFLVADGDGDGRVSLEEIKAKVNDILEAILNLLDQTNDGALSTEDLTTLNLSFSDANDAFTKLFDVLAKGKMAIPMKFNVIEKIGVFYLTRIYYDWNIIGIDKSKQLRNMLANTLDSNQDELLQRDELINFLSTIFRNLDFNQDNAIGWMDVQKFLLKSQILTCLQTDEVETFLEDWIKMIQTQAGKLLDYFFGYLDLNKNDEVTLEETYDIPMCSPWPRNPNDPHRCYDLTTKFYHRVHKPEVPTFEFDGTEREEKMANYLCTVMRS